MYPWTGEQAKRDRAISPTLANLFKVKKCADAEILPSKGSSEVHKQPAARPKPQGLKMQIPKNYLQGGGFLGNELKGSQERFGGDLEGYLDKSDTFPLSSTNSLRVAQELHQAQPEQQVYSAETRDVLAKIIQGDNDVQALREAR